MNLRELRSDDRPDVRPDLAGRLTQGGGMFLRRDRCPGVVIEQMELRPPVDGRGEGRVQTDRHRRAQRQRPVLRSDRAAKPPSHARESARPSRPPPFKNLSLGKAPPPCWHDHSAVSARRQRLAAADRASASRSSGILYGLRSTGCSPGRRHLRRAVVIARSESERHAHPFQPLGDFGRGLGAEIDVEHRAMSADRRAIERGMGLRARWRRR